MAVFDFLKKKKGKQGPRAPKQGESTSPVPQQARAEAPTIAKGDVGVPTTPKGVGKKSENQSTVVLRESRTAWRILREPHVTEKSAALTQFNQYVFKVIGNPAKQEIKKAIQEVYGVHVVKVRKSSVPGKKRRRGKHIGWKSGYKKAIITLKEGEKIEVLPH